MQHVPAGSSYQFAAPDLIQHPHFTERRTEEQGREGALGVSQTKWEQSFPSWDARIFPARGGGAPPGRSAAVEEEVAEGKGQWRALSLARLVGLKCPTR